MAVAVEVSWKEVGRDAKFLYASNGTSSVQDTLP
jgi:hypothetical protein